MHDSRLTPSPAPAGPPGAHPHSRPLPVTGAHLAGVRKPAPWVLGTLCSPFILPQFAIYMETLGGKCLWGHREGRGTGSWDLHPC